MTVEPQPAGRPPRKLRHRLVPATVTFLVAAAAIYGTAYLAISVIRHIVMPIAAVIIAFYLARGVFRYSGRS